MKSRPERLLIVDDNEMNRDMLARRLARKGYEVCTAENACDIEALVQRESGPDSHGYRDAGSQRSGRAGPDPKTLFRPRKCR
jgi:CheY-like chemotaxis protein